VKIAVQLFSLNGKLRLSYVHFEERKVIVSSSRQAKIAVQLFSTAAIFQ